jgi:hypothetical protein
MGWTMTEQHKAMAQLLYMSLMKWADTTIETLERIRDTGVHDDTIDDLVVEVHSLIDRKLAESVDSDVVIDEIEKINDHIVAMKKLYL